MLTPAGYSQQQMPHNGNHGGGLVPNILRMGPLSTNNPAGKTTASHASSSTAMKQKPPPTSHGETEIGVEYHLIEGFVIATSASSFLYIPTGPTPQPFSTLPSEGEPTDIIACTCGSLEDVGFMVCCEVCQTWFHGICVNLPTKEHVANITEWHCFRCVPKHGPSKMVHQKKSRPSPTTPSSRDNRPTDRSKRRRTSPPTKGKTPEEEEEEFKQALAVSARIAREQRMSQRTKTDDTP
ncbi:hypothetical protein PROFUN_11615 [Planoprotostelium fungivorum]|uniref:PHD-type domain-containing protein n=1 Tax=Planoprotostelium fungivorum TaxID=1890364 RepID=A0A2P6N2C7_9EUKA|nr:hypothetical protein PROFUN_11615 [Planoprotostelium fungivorum]